MAHSLHLFIMSTGTMIELDVDLSQHVYATTN